MGLRKKYVNSALTNKTCNKCGNTYPRTEDIFTEKDTTLEKIFLYTHLIASPAFLKNLNNGRKIINLE